MHFLKQYKEKIVKYDLINKFQYKSITKVPSIYFITINLKLKHWNLKLLISALAALELITLQKVMLTKSKVSNVSLKIRKGQPIGCKVTLRKINMNSFLIKLLNKTLMKSKIKNFTTNNLFSIKINNILIFKELEQNYQFFKNLSSLNINVKTTNCTFQEFIFLIHSYKFLRK
jgi:large subunit ribosomal protein L5